MRNYKEVRETSIQKRGDYIHIETAGCVVNIYPCITKPDGRPCTFVSVSPDQDYEYDEENTHRVVKKRA
jgi:hypothetical protein